MTEKFQKISVKGLICKNRAVFMLKDHGGNWELPGGGIEVGEHPDEALRREFKEELGIDDVKMLDLLSVWDFTKEKPAQIKQYIIIIYSCEAQLDNIVSSDEHLAFGWISFSDIDKTQMREGYREAIKKYINRQAND